MPEPIVEAELVAEVDYVSCSATDKWACTPQKLHLRVPVRLLAEQGRERLELRLPLPGPDPEPDPERS